ncbi:MAG: hypothetical protein SNF33_07200 [Candidatus Algichlamydia australiensis]|nr:hypothetical protein [Chlamydiales bacterium]
MNATNLTETSLKISKNIFNFDHAAWSQTAEKVGSFFHSHRFLMAKIVLGVTLLNIVTIMGAGSLIYRKMRGVWPHQVLTANILYPLRNYTPESWKTIIENYNDEINPANKFTAEDREELQEWVDQAEERPDRGAGIPDSRDLRQGLMNRVLEGKKNLDFYLRRPLNYWEQGGLPDEREIVVPLSFLDLKVFNKLSHISDISIKSNEKRDPPEEILDLKNLRSLTLINCTIPENFEFEKLPKLEKLFFWRCDIPDILYLKKVSNLHQIGIANCTIPENLQFEEPSKFEKLFIVDCNIPDITFLEGLSHLRGIDIEDCII